MTDGWVRTDIGRSTPDSITVRGRDLATQVMGEMTFSRFTYLLVSGREPDDGELLLLDAVLASLADHGLTPSALASRLTHTGAPESVQGAIAAGILGGGTVFLGPVEDTARFLQDVVRGVADGETRDDEALEGAVRRAVTAAVAAGRRIPGLGHPVHREADPRTARLYELAERAGVAGPHLRALAFVAEAHRQASGKSLPINGAGAAGAALSDLGFSPATAKGLALVARTAGLVAHLAEEAEHPIGMRLWKEIEGRAGSR